MKLAGIVGCFVAVLCAMPLQAADPLVSRAEVEGGLKKSAVYFREHVAVHGGYVYYQSLDGAKRLGEGVASPTQIWVQPPGTPSVGLAFLEAYSATKDPVYREAAEAAARALLYGQLESGGWTNSIDFEVTNSAKYRGGRGKQKGRNYSTLDDDITQSALRFLIRADAEFGFQQSEIHEAVEYGLAALLKAQYPNGGFPQVWQGPVPEQPVRKASYPDYDWKTENRIKEYWNMYTLNDDLAGDMTDLLILADKTYGIPQQDSRYSDALKRLGDFLILAQMPEPQPGWAQQYNYAMKPCWARKFEPPAVSGRETQDVLFALTRIANHTGDKKYLTPIPAAVKWLRGSLLPDGQVARFYELQSNRPLYMNERYELTYSDQNVPSHYGWKGREALDRIERDAARIAAGKPLSGSDSKSPPSPDQVREILKNLDEQGRWVTVANKTPKVGQPKFAQDEPYISSEVFAENVTLLSRYLTSIK
ncbi:MAG: pectate lyase [Planctomycetaceae bacterium]